MKSEVSTVTTNGQLVIPSNLRRKYSIKEGNPGSLSGTGEPADSAASYGGVHPESARLALRPSTLKTANARARYEAVACGKNDVAHCTCCNEVRLDSIAVPVRMNTL